MTSSNSPAFVPLLRLEGALELSVAVGLYAHTGASWMLFAIAFLAPDIALLGYLAGPRIGALAYNATHAYVGPALTGLLGITLAPAALPYALIWFAHIGFDRALGYGLKSPAGFRETHLGRIGSARA